MLSFITAPLGAFLTTYGGYIVSKILLSLGIGIISYSAVTALIGQLVTLAQSHYGTFPAFALQIANLAGFGQAFGIIAGAVLFRASFIFINKIGLLPK
jgi:hypothetical protein